MIRINLVPRAEARRLAAWQRFRWIGSLVGVAIALGVVAIEWRTRAAEALVLEEVLGYRAQLAELARRNQDVVRLEKRRTELRARLSTIDTLERQRRGPARVLDDLGGATPEKLWLIELRDQGGSLTMAGKGLDNQTIADFMQRLSGSDHFDRVDLVETKQIEEGQAKLKQFTISAHLDYAGRAATKAAAEAAVRAAAAAEQAAGPGDRPQPPGGAVVPAAATPVPGPGGIE